MNEIEFNLLDEPWIRVMDPARQIHEVSLKDALLNAHTYISLSGELPTQDVAVMRLLLAVLHTVYSRVDEDGADAPLDEEEEDEALDRWKAVWDTKRFSEKAITEYLDQWHERFWLFHPERPFFQIREEDMRKQITKQKPLMLSKFNGEISKSDNKTNIFSLYSGDKLNSMSYSQAARWLVYLQSFDDTAIKPQGKNMDSAKVGWLGQIGIVHLLGDSLFETLMLNLILINKQKVECDQTPLWENETVRNGERIRIPFPNNLAELYTIQMRRIHLFREDGVITHYHNLAGDLVSSDNAFEEPMTAWRFLKKEDEKYIPFMHDSSRQMWREFSVLYHQNGNECAGIIKWYKNYLLPNKLIDRRKVMRTAMVAVTYDSSSAHKIENVFSDSLTLHASLLSDLGAAWRGYIETEIERCGKLANAVAYLSQNLYVASGGSNSTKDKHYAQTAEDAKAQLYYRLDIPFRNWLRDIDADADDKVDEKLGEWQETAKQIASAYARELVAETEDAALVGHKVDGTLYSSPKAMNIFKGQLHKIYAKE